MRSHTLAGTTAATYAYRAARLDGAIEMGAIEAIDRDAVSAALAGRGLFPLEITLASGSRERRARMSAADLALGLRLLATLLESGLSMSRALQALSELVPPSWSVALESMRGAVREGRGLAQALSDAPIDVPPVVIGIIHAGEAGSGMAAAVRRAAELAETAAATRAAIRGALAYPILLTAALVVSVGLLAGVVLPRFATILADLGQTLPASTRLVLAAAEWARVAALPTVLALGLAAMLVRTWVATEHGRRRWHELLLSLPVVRTVRHAHATSRAASALSALLESGVPISAALLHASRAAGDAAIEARLGTAREAVIHGGRLGPAMERTSAMTPIAIRLVRAGEESGRLAQMLGHAGRIEQERATETVRRVVRLIEPALILVFGAIVGLVAAALLQAVYSVSPV